jgi:hypothetical protein
MGSTAGRAVNAQRAARGCDALGDVRQAGAALDRFGVAAGSVVADAEAHLGVPRVEANVDRRSIAGMLRRVLQRLQAAEVDRGWARRGKRPEGLGDPRLASSGG